MYKKKYKLSICFQTYGQLIGLFQDPKLNSLFYNTAVLPAINNYYEGAGNTLANALNTFANTSLNFSSHGQWNATKQGMSNGLLSIGLQGLTTAETSGNKGGGSGWTNAGWTNENGNLSGKGVAGIASQGAGMLSNLMTGGKTTAAGNVMNKLGDVAAMVPGPYGAIIAGGLKTLGGITNTLWGSKVNQEAVNKVVGLIGNTLNQSSNALNSTDFANDYSNMSTVSAFSKKDLGSDGVFSHKVKKLNKKLLSARIGANNYAVVSYNERGNNINLDNTMNKLSNMVAFGGPIEYALMQLQVNNNSMSAMSKNRLYSMPNSLNALSNNVGLFAFGGDVNSNGSDYSTGLVHVNAGDTHENSPYEGVLMGVDSGGTPNLVEENEVVYGDYVFSARLKVPKQKVKKNQKATREQRLLNRYKGLTYADAAKKIEHNTGVDERPNDPIAQRGFETDLQILAMSLEKERAALELKDLKEQLDNMSAEEFALLQQQQELQVQQQAMQEQLVLQQLQQAQGTNLQQLQLLILQLPPEQQQLLQLLPPELLLQVLQQLVTLLQLQPNMLEQQAMQDLQTQQQAMQQLLVQAYGGNIHADGGTMEQDDNEVVPLNTIELPELPLQQLQQVQEDTESQESEPQLQEEQSLPNAEDMSTSLLNQTIDQIISWAKLNGNRELVKEGRKAKRASREDKEDFVDDALDEILTIEQLKQQQEQADLQALLQLAAIGLQAAPPEEQQEAVALLQALLQLQAELMQQVPLLALQLDIEALMQDLGLLFAQGGAMDEQLLLEYLQVLQLFMQLIGLSDDLDMRQYYKQYTDLINNNKLLEALLFADLLYRQYVAALLLNLQYAYGGRLFKAGGSFRQIYDNLSLFGLKADDFKKFVGNSTLTAKIDKLKDTDDEDARLLYNYIREFVHTKAEKILKKKYNGLKNADENTLAMYQHDLLTLIDNPSLATKDDNNKLAITGFKSTAKGSNRIQRLNEYAEDTKAKKNFIPIQYDSNGLAIIQYTNPNTKEVIKQPVALAVRKDVPTLQDGKWMLNGKEVNVNGDNFWRKANRKYDWTKYGYIDANGNFVNVDKDKISAARSKRTSNATSKEPNRYIPTGSWADAFTDKDKNKAAELGRDFEEWQGSGYTDFANAVEKKDVTAIERLKELGELSKDKKGENRYFTKKRENGKVIWLLRDDWRDRYNTAVSDKVVAQAHLNAPSVRSANVYRLNGLYVVYDPKNPNPLYKLKSDTPTVLTDANGNTLNIYDLEGGDITSRIYKTKSGNEYLLTPEQAATMIKVDAPSNASKWENPLNGYNHNVEYYTNKQGNDEVVEPYPLPSKWPYLASIGANVGLGLYNAIKGPDTSIADAMIQASKEAGKFDPISARHDGTHLQYNLASNRLTLNDALGIYGSSLGYMANAGNGSAGNQLNQAQALANNLFQGMGKNSVEDLKYNNNLYNADANFYTTRNQKNYDRDLQAAISNLDALTRARQNLLTGQLEANKLKYNIENDWAKGILANLQGALDSWQAYDKSNMAAKQTGWYGRNVLIPNIGIEGRTMQGADGNTYAYNRRTGKFDKIVRAKGGKLRTVRVRKPKGLMF